MKKKYLAKACILICHQKAATTTIELGAHNSHMSFLAPFSGREREREKNLHENAREPFSLSYRFSSTDCCSEVVVDRLARVIRERSYHYGMQRQQRPLGESTRCPVHAKQFLFLFLECVHEYRARAKYEDFFTCFWFRG